MAQREAYLTGLMASIGQLALITGAEAPMQEPEPAEAKSGEPVTLDSSLAVVSRGQSCVSDAGVKLSVSMLVDCHCPQLTVDAIRYQAMPVDTLRDTHWQVRTLAATRLLENNLYAENGTVSKKQCQDVEALLGLQLGSLNEILEGARSRFGAILDDLGFDVFADADGSSPPVLRKTSLLRGTVSDSSVLAVIANILDSADEQDDWWSKVQFVGRLLFGFNKGVLFNVDPLEHSLVASVMSPSIAGFSINLNLPTTDKDPTRLQSILVQSIAEQRITHTIEDSVLAVVDRQLLRLAGAKMLLAIPLQHANVVEGMMIYGLDHSDSTFTQTNLMLRWVELVSRQYHLWMSTRLTATPENSVDLEYFKIRAREVTHEINNPLSIVQNYMKILSLKLGEDESVQADLKTISEEIGRISGIVQKFTTIARESAAGASVTNLNQVVSDIVNMFKGSVPGVRFILQLDENVPRIDMSRDAIKQVLVNLLKNSIEAMENAGSIVVKTTGLINVGGNPFMEIIVADDGPGIPLEIQQQLFKEVQSSKGSTHEGLGLSIVKKLVDEMNGQIMCRSSDESGTDFQILLPVGDASLDE
jgi:signal transduction histidine kinase